MKRYLSADEAADLLSVSKATLYAYVSRGLIRSEAFGGQSRARRYLSEDVRKLRERKDYRRDPAQVAQDALHWGTPLLDSALTLITDEQLYYRGYDAASLAQTSTIERVAALLWTGDLREESSLFPPQTLPASSFDSLASSLTHMQRMTIALTLADDLAAYDLRPQAVARTGARILNLLASAATLDPLSEGGIAAHLARAWQPADPRLMRLLDAALILCADHELNVSSFTARVVASAEATPYAVVTAGLAALQGVKHGGNTERVEAFFHEVGLQDRAQRVTADRLRRGELIPGFGHSLYPHGDPRAKLLLGLLGNAYPNVPEVEFVLTLARRVATMIDHQPNIDFSLTALAYVAHLPSGSPLTLFALGRTVGWIGHAIEQYSSGALIRPRARYVGDPPRTETSIGEEHSSSTNFRLQFDE
ncbi:MAG: helix-turn-helix domain-containing protein [Chloroflexi bacterium]|nr:helix-turn-helix domain-containing protein [Chloroflexota bacterium]